MRMNCTKREGKKNFISIAVKNLGSIGIGIDFQKSMSKSIDI